MQRIGLVSAVNLHPRRGKVKQVTTSRAFTSPSPLVSSRAAVALSVSSCLLHAWSRRMGEQAVTAD